MVFKTVVNSTAKRIPMIRFRKGGLALAGDKGGEQTQSQTTASTTASASIPQQRGPAIEDWELPPRFWRKPIGATEMDYINRGGPA